MSATLTLDDRVREVSDAIAEKKGAAQQAWQRFDTLRHQLAEAGVDDATALEQAEDSHRTYCTLQDEIDGLEGTRERLWSMTQERGKTEPGSPQRQLADQFKTRAEVVTGHRETFGARIANGELYKAASASGIWNRNQQSKIGEVQLGEMMDREEFFALVTGASNTSGGALIQNDLQSGIFVSGDRPLLITDLITVGATDSDTVEYVRMTAFTNNAAPVAEATDVDGVTGLKPQSDLALEKVMEPVRTLAHWVAATRRALADAAQLRSLIDGRLRMGLLQVLETQIVSGSGVGENLLGLQNQTGILAQPIGTDSMVDAIFKAITKVRLKFYEPTAVAINALDWQGIRLAKNGAEDYYFGPPAIAGGSTVWGLPTAVGAQFTAGNPIVGDFRQAELWLREGVQVLASDSHADFFIRNLIAVLAEMRVAFGVPLPEAFCEVTP